MMHNPAAQQKAQEEIDKVVGTERLPGFNDRESLPFVECILKETMRYGPSCLSVSFLLILSVDGIQLRH